MVVPDTCHLVLALQGRALLNAVGNLELKDEYTEALHKLGHDLEAVAEQVGIHTHASPLPRLNCEYKFWIVSTNCCELPPLMPVGAMLVAKDALFGKVKLLCRCRASKIIYVLKFG